VGAPQKYCIQKFFIVIELVYFYRLYMENQEVLKIIENLGGRRAYEERRAVKFGFSSLYEYIKDKMEKKAIDVECKKEETKTSRSGIISKNKSCGCC